MGFDSDCVFDAVKEHMDEQPYKCQCSQCGRDLAIDVYVDDDLDLRISIDPCEDCLEESFEKGKKA